MQKSCGIVLFRDRKEKREYLVLKYPQEADYWGLCKGTVEKGESEEQTALREAEEETGLVKIRLEQGFKTKINYSFEKEGKIVNKEVVYFLGETLDRSNGRISSEHEELLWLPYLEALKKIKYVNDQSVMKKAEDFLNQKYSEK